MFQNDYWEPVFATQDPIPEAVREALSIFCKDKNCSSKKCNCIKEGLKCCIECKCTDCCNTLPAEVTDSDSESEEN